MKHYSIAAAVVAAGVLITANAAAYGLYCENAAASSVTEYSAQLAEAGSRFEAELAAERSAAADVTAEGTDEASAEAAEPEASAAQLYDQRLELYGKLCEQLADGEYSLAEDLIDYDILLKRLALEMERYSALKDSAEELSSEYLVGGSTRQEVSEAEKKLSEKYHDIESVLFDISVLKTRVEAATGEELTTEFDFSGAYLITDALKLSAEELSSWGVPGTICEFSGSSSKLENPDITSQYADAVKGYYELGETLRKYVDAASAYNTAAEDYRLGNISSSQLEELNTAYKDARLEALESKGDYAKLLLALDRASGGALTAGTGMSGGLAEVLSGSLPEALKGSGLWLVRRDGGTVSLTAQRLPIAFDPEKDSGSFEVSYNGTLLCTASIGQTAVFEAPEPADGADRASVTFRKKGAAAQTFYIDIYSPFGEFLED